jgi:single-strand DNA-binding protein
MQKITILGRVGADAEIKEFPSNQLISFSVAVSESYINKTTNEKVTNTTWFDCSKFGNNTQIAQYIRKGDYIYVEGKANNRAYLAADGEAKIVNGINVSIIELLGSKSDNPAPSQPRQERPQANQSNSFIDDKSEDFQDLPF